MIFVLKKLSAVIIALTLMFSAVPVWAAHDAAPMKTDSVTENQGPVIYSSTLNVTEEGGVYKVGFVEIVFKKDFIDPSLLPGSISVEITAVDGVPGIQFSPDIPQFNKEVTIKVDSYSGLLYDKTAGKNIYVNIEKQHLKVEHFSRYAFS
jgi:hypothetical protein